MRHGIVIEKGERNLSAHVPDLPGCVPVGDTLPEQREALEVEGTGPHREALDENISIAGLLAGRGDRTRVGRERKSAAGKPGAA